MFSGEVGYIFLKILDIIVLIFFFLFLNSVFKGKINTKDIIRTDKHKHGKMNVKYKETGYTKQKQGKSIQLSTFTVMSILVKLSWTGDKGTGRYTSYINHLYSFPPLQIIHWTKHAWAAWVHIWSRVAILMANSYIDLEIMGILLHYRIVLIN